MSLFPLLCLEPFSSFHSTVYISINIIIEFIYIFYKALEIFIMILKSLSYISNSYILFYTSTILYFLRPIVIGLLLRSFGDIFSCIIRFCFHTSTQANVFGMIVVINVDIWLYLCWVRFLVLYFGCPFGSLEPMVAISQLVGSVSRILPGVDHCSYR